MQDIKVIYNGTCGAECDSDQGCWGPGPADCKKCRNFLDWTTDTCVETCSSDTHYVYRGECIPCHEACVACRGRRLDDCLDCRELRSDQGCVSKCGLGEYEQDRTCKKCHVECSPVGCSGPLDVEGNGGCDQCPKPVISYAAKTLGMAWENMYVSLSECYQLNESCPESYFEGRVSPNAKGKFGRIAEKQGCIKCHPFCLKCSGYGFNSEVCQECVEQFKNCSCPPGFYYDDEYRSRTFSFLGDFCKPCNIGCKDCTDLRTCKQCDHKSYRLYEKGSPAENGSFVCINTCPADKPFSYYSEAYEKYCSPLDDSLSNDRNIYFPILSIIVLSLIFVVFFKRFSNKIKTYKSKVKVNQPEEEPVDLFESGNIICNITKLKIIKESDVKKTNILGSGAFGTVYRGTLKLHDGQSYMSVAIKVLSQGNKETSTKAFLQEASIMACVDHPNLLRLLAVCVTSNVMLVTQLMPLGDLNHYLRKHNNNIKSTTSLGWCKQIAQGMAFLEEHRLVHRDLAARNVLMQSENQVKVTDFGLARALDRDQDMYASRGGKLPVKWLALECLKQGIFTHKSDVWAFGVTVWEILTYGEEPYEEKTFLQLVNFLDTGERLQQPECCTADLYSVLMTCWASTAPERPSFYELVETFSTMVRDPLRFVTGNIENYSTLQYLPHNYYHGIDDEEMGLNPETVFSFHDYVNV